ncbi:MAG TPA: DMT family transporter [Rhodocyclaceae bacterium]|nr:DMT family transporter [Rhodocyclaceae bacterium]
MEAAVRFAPALFVFLWSTGFIGAKLGLPHADPLAFLLVRFACVVALLTMLAAVLRRPWPSSPRQAGHIAVAGMLLHGGYLAGVFGAIKAGMGSGTVALIVGLQPLATAAIAGPLLGEAVGRQQWLGLALGFGGVALVLSGQAQFSGIRPAALGLALLALASISAGTIYQKRHGVGMDPWTGSALQFIAAALVLAPFALAFGSFRIDWTPRFVFALAWLVLVLSIGAISLLHLLIRRGAATRVAALFYLTPPTTAVLAWLVFDEPLTPQVVAGLGLAAFGVWLALRPAGADRRERLSDS